MRHVFISYSRQDSDYAERLVDALKANGLKVWIDHRIEYGVNWSNEIFNAIRECAAFIVIMSPASRESKWVRREVAYADEIVRWIFPILLEGEPWPLLLTMQHVDARDGSMPSDVFFARLRELVERIPDPRPEAAASAPTSDSDESGPGAFSAPPDDPSPVQERQRKLETAMPACTPIGAESQLRVRISLPDSEGLAAELPDFIPSGDEIHKSDVRGTGFRMRFTPGETRLQDGITCVEVVSDDFHIISATMGTAPCEAAQVRLDVPPDADSRTVIFALEPHENTPQSGSARVYVRIYQDGRVVAESALSTRMVTDVNTHPACELWKMSLAAIAYGPPPLRPGDGSQSFLPGVPPVLESTDDVVDRLLGGDNDDYDDEYPDIGPAPESPRQVPPPPFSTAPPSPEPTDEDTTGGWHVPDTDEDEINLSDVYPGGDYPRGMNYQGADYGSYPGMESPLYPYGYDSPYTSAPYPNAPGDTQEAPIYAEARERAQQNRVLWALVVVMGLQAVLIAVMALALFLRRER